MVQMLAEISAKWLQVGNRVVILVIGNPDPAQRKFSWQPNPNLENARVMFTEGVTYAR